MRNQRNSALILPGRIAMSTNIPMHLIQAEKQPISLQIWRRYGLESGVWCKHDFDLVGGGRQSRSRGVNIFIAGRIVTELWKSRPNSTGFPGGPAMQVVALIAAAGATLARSAGNTRVDLADRRSHSLFHRKVDRNSSADAIAAAREREFMAAARAFIAGS